MCHPIYSIVNNIILGHGTDPTPLAGLGLGALTVGITGLSIGICFAFGAATFMSQEFGRGNFRSLEVYKNRSLFLNTIVFIILFIPSLFIMEIYEAIGQSKEVSIYAAQYVHTVMPFMSFELANWSYQQFLSSQKIMLPSMLGMAVGAAVHAIIVGILYFGCDLGFTAICWATASVFVGRFLCTQCFIWGLKDLKWHDDVHMFSKESVSNLWPLIQVCLGSMFMGIWGWWAFEILTFMAQYLGETEAAAQSIMRSLGLLTFMLPVGYSSASGILTGNAMGAAKPAVAMTYYSTCMFAAMFITVL